MDVRIELRELETPLKRKQSDYGGYYKNNKKQRYV
jgi:hypothetical protein